MGIVEAILLSVITAATPLVLAAIGELVTERSGVLNLGVEGMMIMGAVSAFAITQITGSPYLGMLAGVACGALFSQLFAFLRAKPHVGHLHFVVVPGDRGGYIGSRLSIK